MDDEATRRRIVDVQQSLYFSAANVLTLECGHFAVRPKAWKLEVGQSMACGYCDDQIPNDAGTIQHP